MLANKSCDSKKGGAQIPVISLLFPGCHAPVGLPFRVYIFSSRMYRNCVTSRMPITKCTNTSANRSTTKRCCGKISDWEGMVWIDNAEIRKRFTDYGDHVSSVYQSQSDCVGSVTRWVILRKRAKPHHIMAPPKARCQLDEVNTKGLFNAWFC